MEAEVGEAVNLRHTGQIVRALYQTQEERKTQKNSKIEIFFKLWLFQDRDT